MKANVIPLLSALLLFVGLVAPAGRAHANTADVKILLMASPDFAGAKGTAKYRDRRGEREFQVEVEVSKRLAGVVLTVTVDDVAVGVMTVDAFGKGRLSLNSKLGQPVPAIAPGDVVEVWTAEAALVVSGQF